MFNKSFVALFIINGILSWYTLTSDIIGGIAYTAPFSAWSFGAYMAKMMPIATLSILFFLAFYYSNKEKHVKILTKATPVNSTKYEIIRIGTITFCFLIIISLTVGLSLYFYASLFDYWNFAEFLIPLSTVVLPCFSLALGLGHLIGRIHVGLLYSLMLVTLIFAFRNFNDNFDFFCIGYFSNYPMSLPVDTYGEPYFTVNSTFLLARGMYLFFGIILLSISIRISEKRIE
ncbi:MAG: hypothetical protein FWC41_10385 [Firmicutes bacterium]|nr:hypothetical protein [Bacillota bacterium]